MIIPLDKLLSIGENRYVFSCGAMKVVDKIGNVEGYAEQDKKWKVVPNVLHLVLNESVKFQYTEEPSE